MALPRFQSRSQLASQPPGSGEPPAVHVVTFGCQMNKYDSLLVEGRFRAHGYRVTEEIDEADVVLFNTCSVREHAEERAFSWVGELKRAKERRPELVIGVLGCMAQRAEGEIFARAAHVDIVCGTRRIQHLPELVDELRARRSEPGFAGSHARRLLDVDMDDAVAVDRAGERYVEGLVGHLAVMRGCDLHCTFCIVPRVRGRVQSRPIADLVREARWMVEGGARVLTLLGQTVNSYGEDHPLPRAGAARGRGRQGRPALADLLYALQEIEGLERIRLITLHPAYVTRELAAALRDCSKVDRFLPLPAQSGSDAVLKRMKRGYNCDLYRRRIELLRATVPDIELGSDWIVGFPGETDDDFERTRALLCEIGFAQNYVFKFDRRPGTAAAELADDVPADVKRARNQVLLADGERSSLQRMCAWIGRRVEAVLERESERVPGALEGHTVHGLAVRVEAGVEYLGRSVEVEVREASPFGLAVGLVAGSSALRGPGE
jgi:tRNA-2-methylthio-N6-dimethylallyladenosine synthase